MPTYMLRGLPHDIVGRAKARAREAGTTLDEILIGFIVKYAAKGSIQAQGGRARAEALTPEERSASAQKAARARWRAP